MKIEWRSCFRVGITAFLLFLCITYWPSFAKFVGTLFGVASPLLIGCVIAYIVNILMRFYERHYCPNTAKAGVIKSRRLVCMLAAFLTLVVILALLIAFVVPELAASVQLLVSQVPDAIRSLVDWLEGLGILPENLMASLNGVDWQSKIQEILSVLATGVGNVLGTAVDIVSSVVSGAVTFVLAVIFSIYLLAGKEKIGGQCTRLLRRHMKEAHYEKLAHVLSVLDDCFHRYIVGQCTEAVILGSLCALGMFILRIPYAAMTGAVIAVTALIPVAGAYIGAIVGVLMILTVSPMKAVVFIIFLVILQQVEGNLIYPRVVGTSLGLPAIWVLAAVTIGGGLLGIGGMLVGVPLASAVYRLLREDVNKLPKESVTA